VLGEWKCPEDELEIHINVRFKAFTRRGNSSVASPIIDPLGLLASVILVAKIILKDLCRAGISCEDEADEQPSPIGGRTG